MSDYGKRRRVHENKGDHLYRGNENGNAVNPLNNRPYSDHYYRILEDRKKLPIYEARSDVLNALKSNQVIVLEGETGSGKTTQVPQLLVEEGYADEKMVCCTQPRRVAAMSVSKRVAEEMDVALGEEVGYSIRFEDRTSSLTRLKYVTDGMLLREAMTDNKLMNYSVVVLDEAHERTLSTDILLGLIKNILEERKDLKVIVMSATLDAHKFQEYFGMAPLLKVPGRMFPVEMIYSASPEDDYVKAAIRTAVEIHRTQPPGDVLIFLTGEEEIEDCVKKIIDETRFFWDTCGQTVVLPLYSSLPPDRQQRVFDKPPPPFRHGGPPARKIICSTNVAETSLTIDGVVYVIDPGFAKQKIYNPRVRVESLLVQAISRASAKQRAGRAGRTRPGKCYRLYTEDSFRNELTPTAYPEILRSNLGNVVLQLKKLGIADLVHFDFMDPPAPETLMRALEQLNYLTALDDEGELTEFGQLMSEFPLDPENAACLINSVKFGCSADILSIIAMLSAAPNWFNRVKKDKKCDEARRYFEHSEGDHLTLLNVFNGYKLNQRNAGKWCYDNYINVRAMRSADSVRTQLERIMQRLDLKRLQIFEPGTRQFVESIKRALLSAFFQQVAYKNGKGGQYITCKDQQAVTIHPSCGLSHYPQWVFYHEFVFTKKQYIRTCTAASGPWLIELAPHYFDLENFPPGECKNELRSLYRKRERALAAARKREQEQNGTAPQSSKKSKGGKKNRGQ